MGGTGLIGSHVVTALVGRGCEVRVLSRTPEHRTALRDLPVEVVQGSLESSETIRSALKGIDLLFHSAAPYPSRHFGMGRQIAESLSQMETLLRICRELVSHDLLKLGVSRARQAAVEQAEMAACVARNQPERLQLFQHNLRDPGLLQVAAQGRLNASLHPPLRDCTDLPGLKRIVYTSSVTTIGRPRGWEPGRQTDRLAHETDRYDLAPDPSPYFACKRQLESAVRRMANEGLPVTIVNPTLVIDEGDSHMTTGRLILPIAKGRMPFYLRGNVNAIAGRDVGEGHVMAAMRGRTGQRYILGHESFGFRDLAAMIAEEAGSSAPRYRVPHALAEPLSLLTEGVAWILRSKWAAFPTHGLRMLRYSKPVSISLAVEELGLPLTPVRDAVRRALDWYRAEGVL